MPRKGPLVIVTRKLPDVIETRMMELFDAKLNNDDTPMGRDELVEAMQQLRGAGADRHRPDRLGDACPRRRAAQADRQLRHRRRQYRRRGRLQARHHRHQHARRAHRGHRRHDHGADPRRVAPAGRGRAPGALRRVDRLDAHLDARPPHQRQAARHPRHGPDRLGGGDAGQGLRPRRSTTTIAAASTRRSRTSSRPPTGRASTRCWPGSTSSRSTARTRRPPTTCSRPAG